MVTRVTVTLPDDVLAGLDGIAESEGLTRSDVVREASATYLATRGAHEAARDRQTAVTDGIAWLTEVASAHAGAGEQSLEVLRELRRSAGMRGSERAAHHHAPESDDERSSR